MSVRTPPPPSPSLEDAWTDGDAFSPTTDMYDAVALRRQRNRESMRRMRQRAKDTLMELRATLAALEAHYAKLMAPHEEAPRSAHADRLRARLQQLVQLRRSLEAENGAARAVLEQKAVLQRELRQLLDETPLDEMVNEKLSLLGPRDGFSPLAPAQAEALVAGFCAELARVQLAARTQAAAAPLEVFGWQTRRHVDATTNEMHFEFTKRFEHLTATEMTARAWAQAMDVAHFRATERHLHIRRLEFLQHISPDVKVLVREIEHPVDHTIFRTNYLTFKRATSDGTGFVVGMQSLNPQPNELDALRDEHERVVWIDVAVSVELVACGTDSCRVSWRGRTNYKSPQYAAENAVKFLMGLLRWEAAVVGPLIQLF